MHIQLVWKRAVDLEDGHDRVSVVIDDALDTNTHETASYSHVPSGNVLIQQSLQAGRIGQSLKRAEEKLEKERVLEVLKSSNPSTQTIAECGNPVLHACLRMRWEDVGTLHQGRKWKGSWEATAEATGRSPTSIDSSEHVRSDRCSASLPDGLVCLLIRHYKCAGSVLTRSCVRVHSH